MSLPTIFQKKHPHILWWQLIFQKEGSVVGVIANRVLVCVLFAEFIAFLNMKGFPVHIQAASNIIPSVVLGLLLVFRTNTAYERYWEGRRLWGDMTNAIRNLARQIWVAVEESNQGDRQSKIKTLQLLPAFAVATKLHLRGYKVSPELAGLMSPERYDKLTTMNHPPLEIAFWIADYLQAQYEEKKLAIHQLDSMFKLLDSIVNSLGGSERILRTPLPQAYSIHLRQLLIIYCFSLPFSFVKDLGWWTGIFVALISFTVFGIEAIGLEIENPFGTDPNDIPLDNICENMQRNINDLITFSPAVRAWENTEDII
ncbi:MAG: bestrophin family protein [Microcoleaceae cyanobacterium]